MCAHVGEKRQRLQIEVANSVADFINEDDPVHIRFAGDDQMIGMDGQGDDTAEIQFIRRFDFKSDAFRQGSLVSTAYPKRETHRFR